MIIFRPCGDLIPLCWMPNVHWIVEYYPDDYDVACPYGVLWFTDYRGSLHLDLVSVDFILVRDDYRRKGVATKLVQACRERFGDKLELGEAISESGNAFLQFIDPGCRV